MVEVLVGGGELLHLEPERVLALPDAVGAGVVVLHLVLERAAELELQRDVQQVVVVERVVEAIGREGDLVRAGGDEAAVRLVAVLLCEIVRGHGDAPPRRLGRLDGQHAARDVENHLRRVPSGVAVGDLRTSGREG